MLVDGSVEQLLSRAFELVVTSQCRKQTGTRAKIRD